MGVYEIGVGPEGPQGILGSYVCTSTAHLRATRSPDVLQNPPKATTPSHLVSPDVHKRRCGQRLGGSTISNIPKCKDAQKRRQSRIWRTQTSKSDGRFTFGEPRCLKAKTIPHFAIPDVQKRRQLQGWRRRCARVANPLRVAARSENIQQPKSQETSCLPRFQDAQ